MEELKFWLKTKDLIVKIRNARPESDRRKMTKYLQGGGVEWGIPGSIWATEGGSQRGSDHNVKYSPASSFCFTARWHTLNPQWRERQRHACIFEHKHCQLQTRFTLRVIPINSQPPDWLLKRLLWLLPPWRGHSAPRQSVPQNVQEVSSLIKEGRCPCHHWNMSPYGCRDT